MKKLSLFLVSAFMSTFVNAQNVNIPDTNFKNALLNYSPAIDTDMDGEISTAEASSYTDPLNVSGESIADLTGIEAFTALTELSCYNNQLSSLDVSANTALIKLTCTSNQLSSLDVSANTALTELYCQNNQLSSLDVSASTALTKLLCFNNQLTSLNIANGNNANMTSMWATSNPNLTCIQTDAGIVGTTPMGWSKDAGASYSTNCSASSCTTNIVNIPDTNFKAALVANTAINTDGDTEICDSEAVAFTGTISVSSQSIADLTGIEAFTNLTGLDCGNNTLSSLDISANTELVSLDCRSNFLTSLNVANGKNNLLTLVAQSNPLLTCIQHDAGFDPTTNTNWVKDSGARYSTNCASSCTTNIVNIPDANFKAALVAITAINTDGDTEICTTEAAAFTGTISVSRQGVTDLTGIEAFTNLTGLDCSYNSLSSLDISSNTNLTQLNCNRNALTTLNTNGANSLARLFCFDNQLASLDLSNNTALIRLDCYNNNLASLNLSNNTNLVDLYCYSNRITTLNLPTGTALEVLRCDTNQLASLDVSTSTSLTNLICSNNQLTSLNVSTNTVLEELNCSDNQLTSLTLPTSPALKALFCTKNQLTSLDVSGTTALEHLICPNNQLTSLNVSTNPVLKALNCNMNQLISLNIANGNNSGMLNLYAETNPNLTCINIDSNGTPGSNWQKDNTANYSDDCQGTTFWSKATTGVTTDWTTASNWTNGVPDQNVVTVIPTGATTYPTISSDISTNPISNLTIESTATLIINPSGSLAADTVTNSGTFIIASNATDSGTFEATTVVGDITYQRYATTRWHLVGSPVSGQNIPTFVSYASNALATNATTNAKAFAVYDNTQAQASDYWQYYLGGANSNMINAKGYAVKRKSLALSGTLQFEGTYNHGNVTYTGTGSTNNKFELVSNPYTRYLDLNNFLSSNTSNMSATNAALYFWNDAQNRYDAYNNSSTGNQYVAPGQGFFAEMANTGGSFTFRPNMTTHNATGALLRTAPQTEVLISISEGNSQKTTQIKYLANTGKGLDVGYDAGYFDGHQSNVGIYTKLADGTYNDTNFMLQCVGKDTAEETVIPLGIKTDVARTVTFTAEAMNLPDNLKVLLEDTQTGSVTELSNGGSYEATVNAGSGRFFLHTKESARLSTSNVVLEGINIFKQGNNLQVKGVEEASTVVLHNLQGKEVLNAQVTSSQSLVALPKLAKGMYVVTVSNSKGNTSKKVIF